MKSLFNYWWSRSSTLEAKWGEALVPQAPKPLLRHEEEDLLLLLLVLPSDHEGLPPPHLARCLLASQPWNNLGHCGAPRKGTILSHSNARSLLEENAGIWEHKDKFIQMLRENLLWWAPREGDQAWLSPPFLAIVLPHTTRPSNPSRRKGWDVKRGGCMICGEGGGEKLGKLEKLDAWLEGGWLGEVGGL